MHLNAGPASPLSGEEVEPCPGDHMVVSAEPGRDGVKVPVMAFLTLKPTFFSLLRAVAPRNVVLEEELKKARHK